MLEYTQRECLLGRKGKKKTPKEGKKKTEMAREARSEHRGNNSKSDEISSKVERGGGGSPK